MQDVGQQQFLMLLLVIEPDLDDRERLSKSFGEVIRLDGGIDMGAICVNFGASAA